jgi:DNA-binding response OmpR family regulator
METWKALLVDDEEDFVTTLAERIALRGIQAATANSGEAALELIETDPPRVVVVDVIMPGMGGLEVLRQVKILNPAIEVILLTGRGSTKEGIEGMRLGAYDYLMKPIKIEELIAKMREAAKTSDHPKGKEQYERE